MAQTRCGSALSVVGPFYCQADHTVYIDPSVYKEIGRLAREERDIGWSYVIAHELAHHVQKLTGVDAQVARLRRLRPSKNNELTKRFELQADCYAGVVMRSLLKRRELSADDVREGLQAVAAVGDDRLRDSNSELTRHAEILNHGSSAERTTWFKTGLDSGAPSRCDTLNGFRDVIATATPKLGSPPGRGMDAFVAIATLRDRVNTSGGA